MIKRTKMLIACLCYTFGVLCAFYVGGWMMILQPIMMLINAFRTDTVTWSLVIVSIIKIVCSGTLAGLIWCIGYIARNHFIGKDEPEWDSLDKKQSA